MDESSSMIFARALVSLRTLVIPSSCMMREEPTWYICFPPIWMLSTEDSFVTVPSEPRMSNRLSVCTAMELPLTLSMTFPRASKVWIVASRPANSSSMLTVVFWMSSQPVRGSARAVVSARVVRVFLRCMVVPFVRLVLAYTLRVGLSINKGCILTLLIDRAIVTSVKNETLSKLAIQSIINVLFGIFFMIIFIMPIVLATVAWKLELGIASLFFLGMYWWVFDVCKAYKNPVQ